MDAIVKRKLSPAKTGNGGTCVRLVLPTAFLDMAGIGYSDKVQVSFNHDTKEIKVMPLPSAIENKK